MRLLVFLLFMINIKAYSQNFYNTDQILNKVFVSTTSVLKGKMTKDQVLNTVFNQSENAFNISVSTTSNLEINYLKVNSNTTILGNVGIGTPSSYANLVVDGGTNASYVRVQGNSDGDNYGALEIWSKDATPRKWQFAHKSIAGNQYDFSFAHFDGTSWKNPFIIKSNGNVGIGTTEPNYKFVVNNGTMTITTAGNFYNKINGEGIILTSPSGTCYKVSVNDIGVTTTTVITCP